MNANLPGYVELFPSPLPIGEREIIGPRSGGIGGVDEIAGVGEVVGIAGIGGIP